MGHRAHEWITFLTDYGVADSFVGVCHGVMAAIAPDARVIDVTHLVPRGNVAHGAEVLRQAIRYLPAGVHLAVVDPGVGTSRKAIVIAAGQSLLVGPDNGLLIGAAEELGGADAAFSAENAEFFLDTVSATFHGRDIFAPVAAHLSTGISPAALGPPVDAGTLVRLPAPVRRVSDGVIHGQVVLADRFGNLQTSLDRVILEEAGITAGSGLRLESGGHAVALPYALTFGSVAAGQPLAYIDSAGRLALAINQGNAQETLALPEGAVFTLGRVPGGRP